MQESVFTGTPAPGIRQEVAGNSATSTSPATLNVSIPSQGVWLVTIHGWYSTQNNSGSSVYVVTWLSYGSGFRLGATRIAGPVNNASNGLTDITLAAPSTAGVCVATVTWSPGTSTGVAVSAVCVELSDVADINF